MCETTIFIVSVTSEIFYMGVKFDLSRYGYKKDHVLGQISGQRMDVTGGWRESYNREL
jgi:hypothetical protein